jgi:sporulation protein YlmC with PRC-barrel domain
MTSGLPSRADLVYRILDDQLVDVDGRRCGRADDLEFDGGLGEPPRLYAILSGSGTWHRRLPRRLRTLGKRIFGSGTLGRDIIQVPWEQVDRIDTAIHLKAKAREMGLGQGDDRQAELVEKLPKS